METKEFINRGENEPFSLLFLHGKHSAADGITDDCAEQLELYSLLDLHERNIGDFFTDDAEVIRYRQMTFADLEKEPGLCDILLRMLPFLSDITELRRMNSSADTGDGYLYSISEVEIFTSLMQMLHDELLAYAPKISSPAMRELCRRVSELTDSKYFKELCDDLSALSARVRDIRSLTVGVNLDARLSPESMGVVSVNSEKFKSGEFLEKIRRLDFKKDDMTCIAELIPYSKNQPENRRLAMINAVNNAVSDVFHSSLKAWKRTVQNYVLDNTDFLLRIMPEIEFLTCGAALIKKLRERGCPICTPEIAEDGNTFKASGLCNPVIALKTDAPLVPNDISFDKDAMIYVITGPNRGGKSVLTCAVGHAFAMAQLGLPVCADSASISVCDKILTHFPTGSEDTVEKGRLGEECDRLGKIFDAVTEKSLVLLDESLSSTGSYEGAYIAAEVLQGFSMARLRCIFSTHLHDLAASVDKINAECLPKGGVPIDNMVAEVQDGQRSFKIVRKTPDGKSYARDIAEKYGLSVDRIMEKINKQ